MSDKKDWSKVERTQYLVDYVYDKYGNTTVIDEMLDNMYNFAMIKGGKRDCDLGGSSGKNAYNKQASETNYESQLVSFKVKTRDI
ncbi:hypothetical protein Tco_1192733 [Tanacetum coccineum]